ncbi:VanZ family protein [Undibacterium fentianense]|uniref:VanZ family protein n=1 Tax=Undibacterium fentianense TaxID=2828728 RepID=UPI002E3107FB|nr:VanZ family protein [Undibacterium fentianense]
MSNQEPQSSPFFRASLVAYAVLIIYASLYPFSGWHFENLAAFGEQFRQWPRYRPLFDSIVNILGYIPFGSLIVFAMYPRFARWSAVLGACLIGITMSACMESTQFFLPTRVTSLLDLITNGIGTILGAIIGGVVAPSVFRSDALQRLRTHWLQQGSSRELVVLGLWPLAQLFPQAFLFGHGQILPIISLWCEEYLDISIDLSDILRNGIELSAENYLLSETIITACGCSGAILLWLSLFNRHAPKFVLSCLLLVSALAIKALSYALMFQPENAFLWLAPGAQGGIAIGILMLYGFSFTPNYVQRRLAMILLIISFFMVNLIPSNPYFLNTLQTLVQGKMLNFYGAAQFLSVVWPLMAIWYLINPKRLSTDQHTQQTN